MHTLQGKLALVTGAASGIGRALAFELARSGCRLILVDIEQEKLLETAEQAVSLGADVHWKVVDLSVDDETANLARYVRDEFPTLDILVNNAGVAYYGVTHEMTQGQWQRLLGINLHAPLRLTHELLPTLCTRPQAHVLNVCSIAGLVGVARLAAYNTTKYALVGFSESIRAEYGPRGIGVTALCPGLVKTRIFDAAMTGGSKSVPRFPRWLTASPESIARRAIRAIRRNEGLVVVTAPARVIWWTQRLVPSFLGWLQRVRRPVRNRMSLQSVEVEVGATTQRAA